MVKSSAPERMAWNSLSSFATIVLMTVFGSATENEDPSILNSNLFPVNANGLVLLRSVVSLGMAGSTCTPSCIFSLVRPDTGFPSAMASSISVSSSPRKTETMAGGASLAPSLWSFPAEATDILSRS